MLRGLLSSRAKLYFKSFVRGSIDFPSPKAETSTCVLASRSFTTTKTGLHGEFEWQDPKTEEEVVNVIYIDRDGNRIPIRGKVIP